MRTLEIDVIEEAQDRYIMTIKIRRIGRFRFRCWLVMQLLTLIDWIAPFGFLVEVEPDTEMKESVQCDYACSWVPDFGFVPECGCPIHDPED